MRNSGQTFVPVAKETIVVAIIEICRKAHCGMVQSTRMCRESIRKEIDG